MTSIASETHFEDIIVESLTTQGGWRLGANSDYDPDTALIFDDLVRWLEISAPQNFNRLKALDKWKDLLLKALLDSLRDNGIVNTLHKDLIVRGIKFKLIQYKPNGTSNPELVDLYHKNQLTVLRQLHYSKFSKESKKSLDLALFINGIPIATMELKTDNTQSVRKAMEQYREDRHVLVSGNPEPLFTFNVRCLAHFAVSTDEVWVTTKLAGASTFFMPFNKNNHSGQDLEGNEKLEENNGLKTEFFYKDILAYDSILDIVENYVVYNKSKNAIYFPRYHQLDGVRKAINDVVQSGVGNSYLFEHSAGSGKSNTISWLVAQLYSLHNDTKAIFDKIILVTDRKVLDQQIRENMKFIFQEKNALKHIDRSTQLAKEINSPTRSIIITTIQKFKFALGKISEQSFSNNYAIIIDEAHSSQSGKNAKAAKKACGDMSVDKKDKDSELSSEIEDAVEEAGKKRNISYFAFTATPTNKTYQVFGTRPYPHEEISDDNVPYSFHLYTMKQAISEGYIIDVMGGFYNKYGLVRELSSDYPDYKIDIEGENSIDKYVDEQPVVVEKKAQLIVDSFLKHIYPQLNYQAKAMVVTSSRRSVCLLKAAIDKELEKRKLSAKIKTLGAFEGSVRLREESTEEFTEATINDDNVQGDAIKEQFGKNEYKILIVANKFQTGFDQPLLCGMFVDKTLSGISAVQTLSRLNRCYPGKSEATIFIEDFKNDRKNVILQAFARYYRGGRLGRVNKFEELLDIYDKILDSGLVEKEEIRKIFTIFRTYKDQKSEESQDSAIQLTNMLGAVYDRYLEASELQRREFAARCGSFIRAFGLLTQIYNYRDMLKDLEEMQVFCTLIRPRIAEGKSIDETFLRTIKIESLTYIKEFAATPPLDSLPGSDVDVVDYSRIKGKLRSKDLLISLEKAMKNFNTINKKLDFYKNIIKRMLNNHKLAAEAANNDIESFYKGSFFEDLKRALLQAGIEDEGSKYNLWFEEPNTTAYPFVMDICKEEIYNIFKGDLSFEKHVQDLEQKLARLKGEKENLEKDYHEALEQEKLEPDG